MNIIQRWLSPPRTIGCPDARTSSVNDELSLLGSVDRREYVRAMELVLGKNWKKVPTREMMGLINMRFGTTPIDYSKKEVAPILHLMNEHAKCLSVDQAKFLRENDHLPRSVKQEVSLWMDKDELAIYAKKEDEVHKKRMDYFITMNGVVSAYAQSLGKSIAQSSHKTKKEFQFTGFHMAIITIIVIGTVIFIIL